MRRSLYKLSGAAALACLVMVGLAAAPQDRPQRQVTHRWIQLFGMVSPANGQTIRVHVTHFGLINPPEPIIPGENPPPEPETPPDPMLPPDVCRVTFALLDQDGQIVGRPVVKVVGGGASAFVDFVFTAPTGDVVGFPPGPCRAAVWISQRGPRGEHPPDPCRASVEVLDNVSGRASLHLVPAVQRALPAVQ